MSIEAFKTFLAKVQDDEEFRNQLRAAGGGAGMPAEAVVAFAARKGYAFTPAVAGELSDQELDAVAGGLGLILPTSSPKDTLSELSEAQQLMMQMVMDRMTKAESAASNTLKKISDTASGIISNLK
jgi:predicted ribosomally synthesized peptide with nif11-like leader